MFKVQDVSLRYPGNAEDTIKGVSFAIEEGEIFGLLGPSGVGKSTTQRILVKLLRDYRGQVFYRDRDLRACGKEFYEQIGVGFEMPVHFAKLTAAENLAFFRRLYRSRADTDALMKRLGLYQDRHKRVGQFSKGMKIRLNFVRALLNNPRMLFLDEPTMGLDPVNARIIKDLIKEFREDGGTVLLTTHLMNDVDELCDRVAFMVAGRIKEIDSPKNMKLKHGARRVEVEYGVDGRVSTESFDLDTLPSNDRFVELVRNTTILTIHSQEMTLDDIFIKVMGMKKDE